MNSTSQTGIVRDIQAEITVEDLEFNLEKHKDCEYSENIYEFLFHYEKGINKGFVSVFKEKLASSPEKKGKTNYLVKNNSLNPQLFSDARNSVCLKLPERKKNGISSMNFGVMSPGKKTIDVSGRKGVAKSPKNLVLCEKIEKISPYGSLSPRGKNLIIRSPGVRVKNHNKK